MTVVRGHTIIVCPCCGTSYRTPQYSSISLMAFGYWTDGEMDDAVSSVNDGLRKCQCGSYYLLRDAVRVDFSGASGVPNAQRVNPSDLPEAIRRASSPLVELAARRNYWRHLNDAYRTLYRAHRDSEEAESDARWLDEWRATLTPWQRLIQRLKNTQPPQSLAPFDRPFTIPPYTPTAEQLDNMKRLLTLILVGVARDSRTDWLEVAELHRELSQFDAAAAALINCAADHQRATKNVIDQQIRRRSAAPIRYLQ